MSTVVRWVLAVVVGVHGIIHLLGAVHGFGWADVPQMTEPIAPLMAAVWLAAAGAVLLAAALLAVAARGWWIAAAVGAVISQAVILTSWTDAAAGTVVNVLLLLAAAYGLASQGPVSYRAEYRRRVAAALTDPAPAGVVTDADVDRLPGPVAAYVRRSGAVGRPRVGSFAARIHGRIRQGVDKPWMQFTAEQVNTCGTRPSRLFLMDATMFGLPVDVLHTYVGADATMRAKVCSLVPVLDVAGEEMTRAETVTLFNDLCIFAPAALVDVPVAWQITDERRVIGTYTNAGHSVTADLVFNDRAELVDFVSDDRLAATPDGKGFVPQRWSTPLRSYGTVSGQRLATAGEGRWHPPDQPAFPYIELHLDDVVYNPGAPPASQVTDVPALQRA